MNKTVLLFCLLCPTLATATLRTYEVVPATYPDAYWGWDDHKISGWVTADAELGEIVDWRIDLSGPFEFTWGGRPDSTMVGFEISPTEIYVDLDLLELEIEPARHGLVKDRVQFPGCDGCYQAILFRDSKWHTDYLPGQVDSYICFENVLGYGGPVFRGQAPLIDSRRHAFAVIPEPSAFAMLAVVALSLATAALATRWKNA